MTVLDVIFRVSGVTALIALPFVFFVALPLLLSRSTEPSSQWRERIAGVSVVVFIVSVVIGLAAAEMSQDIAEDEVVTKLKSLPDDCHIAINGAFISNSKQMLEVLRSIDRLPAHRSSPTKEIWIDVADPPSHLVLRLARDSSDPREYWVFDPKHDITRYNEIGRIKTALLDNF